MSIEAPIRTEYLAARARADAKVLDERARFFQTAKTMERGGVVEPGRPWGEYTRSAYLYESAFRPVMRESFGDFFARRRSVKGKVFALDVMGAATFTRPAIVDDDPAKRVDGQMAMTLVDFRTPEEKLVDKAINRVVLEDDIMGIRPWLDAQEFIDKNDDTAFPGFDLITCRPLGGWDVIRESRASKNPNHDFLEWAIVQRMFRLLSPNGGTMLVKMATRSDYSEWIEKLQEVEGIDVVGERNFIKIVRNTGDRFFLPRITGVQRDLEPEI